MVNEDIKFRIGDHVKLRRIPTSRQSKSKANWKNRTGTVIHVGLYNQSVSVRWEGRMSVDQWPVTALRKVS
jgi:ribosomal protein L21E